MKKTLLVVSLILALTLCVFVLTGCENESGDETVKSNENTEEQLLTLDLGDDEIFQAKFEYPQNSNLQVKGYEDDETHVTITDEKEKYQLDIYLGDEVDSTFLETQEDDKEYDGYTETKFGNFEGYYYKYGEEEIDGNIILENETYNEYMYIYFTIRKENDVSKDIEKIYKSKDVQNILNSFGYRFKTLESVQ